MAGFSSAEWWYLVFQLAGRIVICTEEGWGQPAGRGYGVEKGKEQRERREGKGLTLSLGEEGGVCQGVSGTFTVRRVMYATSSPRKSQSRGGGSVGRHVLVLHRLKSSGGRQKQRLPEPQSHEG